MLFCPRCYKERLQHLLLPALCEQSSNERRAATFTMMMYHRQSNLQTKSNLSENLALQRNVKPSCSNLTLSKPSLLANKFSDTLLAPRRDVRYHIALCNFVRHRFVRNTAFAHLSVLSSTQEDLIYCKDVQLPSSRE